MIVSAIIGLYISISSTSNIYSLQKAVNQALERDPNLKASHEYKNEGKSLEGLSKSNLLPRLSASFDYAREKDSELSARPRFNGNSFNSFDGSLVLSQPIFVKGLWGALSVSNLETKIREIDYKARKREVTLKTIKSFFHVLYSQALINALKRSEAIHRQSLKEAEHRRKIGRSQLLDVLQEKTQLALLLPRIETAEGELRSSIAEFLTLIQHPTDHNQPELLGQLVVPDENLILQKLESGPQEIYDIKKAELNLEKSKASRALELSSHWPRIDGHGQISRSGTKISNLTNTDATAWAFGFNMTIPLLTGMSLWKDLDRLNAQDARYVHQLKSAMDQALLGQIQAKELLKTSSAVIKSSKIAFELASESMKEAKRSYKVATIDFLQMLTTTDSMLNAEMNLNKATMDFIESLTNYTEAHGLSEDLLVSLLDESSKI